MKLISEKSVFKAWLEGAKHLEKTTEWEDFNVVLAITNPREYSTADKKIETAVDKLLRGNEGSLHTVAETIFPLWLYQKYGAKGFFEIYPEKIYKLIKKDKDNKWGTYAYRLVRRKDKDGKKDFNPLKELIKRMKDHQIKGKQKARFELSVTDMSEEVSIYEDCNDRTWPVGGPCMSHLSFKLDHKTKTVHLSVMYRSHYYMQKTLGNLIGLARLQTFVAEQVGCKVGELIVVSTFAKLDLRPGGWNKKQVETLLKGLR